MSNSSGSKDDELLAHLLNSKGWEGANEEKIRRHRNIAKRRWSRSDLFALFGIIVAIITIVASLIVPEVRRWLRIEPNVTLPGKNVPVEDAIRVEYHYGSIENIVLDSPPKHLLSYYKQRSDLLIPIHPTLSIDVISQAEDEWIKIAPFTVVRLLNIRPITNTVYLHVPGIGGPALSEFFRATFSPDQESLFGAPFTIHDSFGPVPPNTNLRDQFTNSGYFSLKPGERDVFISYFGLVPGYYYQFKIGIPYSYKGINTVKWLDRTFIAGIPIRFMICSGQNDVDFKCSKNIEISNNDENISQEQAKHIIEKERQDVYAGKAFTWETVFESIQSQKGSTSTP